MQSWLERELKTYRRRLPWWASGEDPMLPNRGLLQLDPWSGSSGEDPMLPNRGLLQLDPWSGN